MDERNASDAHLRPGLPVIVRVDGQLGLTQPAIVGGVGKRTTAKLENLTVEAIDALVAGLPQQERVAEDLRIRRRSHLRVKIGSRLAQAHVYYAGTALCLSLRRIGTRVPAIDELRLPPVIEKATHTKRGMIIVAGNQGSGKTTTAYAMLNHINLNRSERIATCEGILSYDLPSKMSVVTQQEVGVDVNSYADAVEIAVHTGVDILMLGDLPDAAAATAALRFAENGKLVFVLLPGASVEDALEALIDRLGLPRDQACRMIARVLQIGIAQRLLSRVEAGRIAVNEILISTKAIRDSLAAGVTDLRPLIEEASQTGMQTMDSAITRAYQCGEITYETAMVNLRDPKSIRND